MLTARYAWEGETVLADGRPGQVIRCELTESELVPRSGPMAPAFYVARRTAVGRGTCRALARQMAELVLR